jgi:hypothetical protein
MQALRNRKAPPGELGLITYPLVGKVAVMIFLVNSRIRLQFRQNPTAVMGTQDLLQDLSDIATRLPEGGGDREQKTPLADWTR